jgi:hypothetical protein
MNADAIRVANTLMADANEFERESAYWSDYPRLRVRLLDASGLLFQASRNVIRLDDPGWGESWHRSAVLTLSQIQLVRLFRDGKWTTSRR